MRASRWLSKFASRSPRGAMSRWTGTSTVLRQLTPPHTSEEIEKEKEKEKGTRAGGDVSRKKGLGSTGLALLLTSIAFRLCRLVLLLLAVGIHLGHIARRPGALAVLLRVVGARLFDGRGGRRDGLRLGFALLLLLLGWRGFGLNARGWRENLRDLAGAGDRDRRRARDRRNDGRAVDLGRCGDLLALVGARRLCWGRGGGGFVVRVRVDV
jgi:hypothetical protein